MAAIDDLTELVERAAAAEKSALASKWKDERDVQSLIRRSRTVAEEHAEILAEDERVAFGLEIPCHLLLAEGLPYGCGRVRALAGDGEGVVPALRRGGRWRTASRSGWR